MLSLLNLTLALFALLSGETKNLLAPTLILFEQWVTRRVSRSDAHTFALLCLGLMHIRAVCLGLLSVSSFCCVSAL